MNFPLNVVFFNAQIVLKGIYFKAEPANTHVYF